MAQTLLQRQPVPGEDYALTEVVRCKSIGERGFTEARDHCSARYLLRTLQISPASVVVILGEQASCGVREPCDWRQTTEGRCGADRLGRSVEGPRVCAASEPSWQATPRSDPERGGTRKCQVPLCTAPLMQSKAATR